MVDMLMTTQVAYVTCDAKLVLTFQTMLFHWLFLAFFQIFVPKGKKTTLLFLVKFGLKKLENTNSG